MTKKRTRNESAVNAEAKQEKMAIDLLNKYNLLLSKFIILNTQQMEKLILTCNEVEQRYNMLSGFYNYNPIKLINYNLSDTNNSSTLSAVNNIELKLNIVNINSKEVAELLDFNNKLCQSLKNRYKYINFFEQEINKFLNGINLINQKFQQNSIAIINPSRQGSPASLFTLSSLFPSNQASPITTIYGNTKRAGSITDLITANSAENRPNVHLANLVQRRRENPFRKLF